MRRIIEINIDEILPARADVLRALGVPRSAPNDDRIARLADDAVVLVGKLASPVVLTESISAEAFAPIYDGEGKNAPDTPLARTYPRSVSLALFALTIGEKVSRHIADFFARDEFSQGTALDAAASECVERAVQTIERSFQKEVRCDGASPEAVALSFSPGYCGWDVSAQRRLFNRLLPSEIGIELNESCLMQPLKSVSGVLVAGPVEIFEHDEDFPFCERCKTRECRTRLNRLKQQRQKI